ncbi:tetratricopeptide repeat protein [Aerosakkonema funiforme]|uniref:tetratricopeptide repeat protein n=1 Tax=Aerosakkonema funiforme TaxID=1246630 RepID=UPI0035B95EBC
MRVQRQSNGQMITLNTELGGGGEGKIYSISEEPLLVAKVYHQSAKVYTDKLSVMFANPPDDSALAQGRVSIAWPVDLLKDTSSQQIIGFLMRRVTEVRPIHDFYIPATRRDKSPYFNYLYLHRTARNLAAAVSALHAKGYVIGDVNESNILVTETALVTLVDTDSFQVLDLPHNKVYRCPVGKPEFTPPELQGKAFRDIDRTPEHDLFGLAVVIFQLLMEGTHPFDGVFQGSGDPPPKEKRILEGHFPYGNRFVPYGSKPLAPAFEVLHPTLRQLFIRCFEDGHNDPKARPDAKTWVKALVDAENAIVTCSVNDQHLYGGHLSVCPWCERTVRLGGRDPFPARQAVEQEKNLQSTTRKLAGNFQKQQTHQTPVTTHTQPILAISLAKTIKSFYSIVLRSKKLNVSTIGLIGVVVWVSLGIFSNMNPATHSQRGDERYQDKDYQQALKDYTQAISLAPDYAIAYLKRGNVQYQLEKYQEAVADYTQAIRINPNLPEAHYNRGNSQLAVGNLQAAIKDYTEAIRINPNLAQAYNNRGIAHGLAAEGSAAVEDFSRAIAIYPITEFYWGRSKARRMLLKDRYGAEQDYYQGSSVKNQELLPNESKCFLSYTWCGCGDKNLTRITLKWSPSIGYCPRKILDIIGRN